MTQQQRDDAPPPAGRTGNAAGWREIPRGIWALGFVSMAMDVSSEMIHALLPVFLVVVLGAGTTEVGLIEGVAEAAAQLTRIVSGPLSDRLGSRKGLAVLGYGLAALSKPLFPLATSAGWVFAARFIDRIGKGIRGAPRDALIGEIAPPHLRGACYGLRQSLDTVGAFAGPLLATLLMVLTGDSFRVVFWAATVPACLAVVLLVLGVEEPKRIAAAAPSPETPREPIRTADLFRLGPAFWRVVAIATLFALARFSEAFLVLRATDVGLDVALAPLVLVGMNVVYAVSAYPAGLLSDRSGGRWRLLAAGFAVLAAADLVLAAAPAGIAGVAVGVALWGLHMGLTQGILAALVADAAPADRRGTAFGIFSLAGGLAALLASLLAGFVWSRYGAPAPFLAGAGLTFAALIGTGLLHCRRDAPGG